MPFTKINKNESQNNVKHKTTKLLEDNIRESLDDLVYDSNFLDAISKAQLSKK